MINFKLLKKIMKTILFYIALFHSIFVSGQTQIENGGFETWENIGQDTEEPAQWSSLKTSDDNSWLNLANQAPQVIWRDGSAHSGNYCIKMVVASYNSLAGVSPNAIVTNGRVFASTNPSDAYVYTDESSSSWKTPCSSRPDSVVGWYKYAPQGGDKASFEVLFHTSSAVGTLPAVSGTSHWVGNSKITFSSAKSNWTRFSFPINWLSSSIPSYVLMIGAAGDGTNAVTGSTLYLDDLAFVYNPPPANLISYDFNFNFYNVNQTLFYNLPNSNQPPQLTIFNLNGQQMLSEKLYSNQINHQLNSGVYIYQVVVDQKVINGKIFIK
jgi:hypothetical protein